MMQIIEQTDKEKLVMYMKLPKKTLAKMLIQCNKILDNMPLTYYEKAPELKGAFCHTDLTFDLKTNIG